jgi:sugar O-acyltransferase (sialic acid O-acetyltransferase NeuD family)
VARSNLSDIVSLPEKGMNVTPVDDRPSEVILWGGTGQAKVVRPILERAGIRVVAVFDHTPNLPPPFPDVPLYLGWQGFEEWRRERRRDRVGFCVAIGNPHGRARIQFHERLEAEGLHSVTVIHPSAVIAEDAVVGEGCQFMAGSVVNPEVRLGRQCIINTQASVDHECVLEDGCELAPGATLCGLVYLETNAWVCAGATVLPRVRIGHDAIVGAGAVVRHDVPAGVTVVGTPARPMTKRDGPGGPVTERLR